ncbi:MAG: serine hydrolase [Corynebacterium sp.]|uniref:serine hydrolase n=1 Tax=Corynebacterium sp. TaxID=1720 RepID=UPI0026DD38C3|nr:serine hydrolase [Corynebacterium sp.]MDO4760625.1 serine hydrolase [Corynebacterium sp.]
MKDPISTAVVATMRMFIFPKRGILRLGLLALVPIISSCAIERGAARNESGPSVQLRVETTSTRALDAPATVELISQAELDAIVADIEAGTGAQIGVAVGEQVSGSVLTQVAWSTSKVPVALAALRLNPELAPIMYQALSSSDNTAAQQLWDFLGGGDAAAQAANQILREAGDMHTEIQPNVIRPGYSAFGQTYWSVADQARFAEGLKNIPESAAVLDAMADIIPAQRYGLGRLDNARFKGGWGPLDDGTYLVRQYGLIPSPNGEVGIALLVLTHDGYEAGHNVLDQLALRLGEAINPD